MQEPSHAVSGLPVSFESERLWRFAAVLAVLCVVVWLVFLRTMVRREIYHLTGSAQWIWVSDGGHEPHARAEVFEQVLELTDRPVRAIAKVCGDPQYVLSINGGLVMAGRNRPQFVLDVVPVTDLLQAGRNVITIEVRSPSGVGGLLFALDLEASPLGRATGDLHGRNVLVSGSDWRIRGRPGEVPWVWGQPPDQPWSYPGPRRHAQPLVQAVVGERSRQLVDTTSEGDVFRWESELETSGAAVLALEFPEPTRGVLTAPTVSGEMVGVEVIMAPDTKRWLFPGLVRSGSVSWQGERLPTSFELVETDDTALLGTVTNSD